MADSIHSSPAPYWTLRHKSQWTTIRLVECERILANRSEPDELWVNLGELVRCEHSPLYGSLSYKTLREQG